MMRTGLRARRIRARVVLGLALPVVLVTGCSQDDATEEQARSEQRSGEDEETAAATPGTSEPSEVSAEAPRLALTYDGGIQILDAATLELAHELALDGFNRLNPAGDGQHLLVSTDSGFEVLDAGTWAEPHGDHNHYYTASPQWTDVGFDAEVPGHVVVHEGRTALFDDGTGNIIVADSGELAEGVDQPRQHTTSAPHHGVGVELSDGTLVVSEGTDGGVSGVRVLDASDEEIAASDNCPGLHGEAVAAGEAVVVGCEDGALLYAEGSLSKIDSPNDYGRIGNQAGTEQSPVVLGDYKTDPDAELERPTQISLIDTRSGELQLVDLPSSYSFRSLARGDDGEALVLGTDGQIHVIDPESGELTQSIPVIDEWEEPTDWQRPRPTIFMLAGSAYVTDPNTNSIHAVDIVEGEIWQSAELAVTPNELSGVTGDAEAPTAEAEHHEHEHGEEPGGHDHDGSQ